MPRTRALPWEKWYPILSRFSEWLVLISIACIGLPPAPGIVSLLLGLFYFESKPDNHCAELTRYWTLKHKSAKTPLTKEEEIELSEYEAGLVLLEKPKFDEKHYWIGFGMWSGSLFYLMFKAVFRYAHSGFWNGVCF